MACTKSPSVATAKRLFAVSGNRCAFPGCHCSLIDRGSGVVTGELCHICAASPDGPRHDPKQTDTQRHGFENLLLLCGDHHKVIDGDVVTYTVEKLLALKVAHEAAQVAAHRSATDGMREDDVVCLVQTILRKLDSLETVMKSQPERPGQRNDESQGQYAASGKRAEVFVSSTCDDLGRYREAVRDAALEAGLFPVMSEHWAAKDNPPLRECLRRVEGADVLVVVVAHRFGWVPSDQPETVPAKRKSITWLECEQAKADGKEVLAFLVEPECEWPVGFQDAHELMTAARENRLTSELAQDIQWRINRLKDFKAWLSAGRVRKTFASVDDLRGKVCSSLSDWAQRHGSGIAMPITFQNPTKYLQFLRTETSHIDIRGLQVGSGKANRFPIDELYIPLTTSVAAPVKGPRKGPAKAHTEEPEMREARRVELEEALENRCLVIIGDPGAGKSTFANRIANLLCRHALGETVDQRLAGVVGKAAFPILVKVGDLVEYLEAAHKQGQAPTHRSNPCWVSQYAGSCSQASALGLDEGFFMQRLEDGRATVLIDGLDEAPSAGLRQRIVELVEGAAGRFQLCRFVVTTRPAAYRDQSILPGFTAVEIDPLEDEAIENFLGRWCQALYPGDAAQAARHKKDLLDALRARGGGIRRLARNPVMLTALAVVHWNEKRLPEQRADLYESIIKWLSMSRKQKPGRPQPERCVALLQNVALVMQDHEQGRQVQVRRHWAALKLASEWRELPAEQQVEEAQRFLQEEELDSGIIVKRGDDMRFWHLTFQEYLAARALAAKDVERLRCLQSAKPHSPEWREVILLLAGVLYHQGIDRVDGMFSAMLDHLGPAAKLSDHARCVGLLGAAIRDLSPVGYKPLDKRYQEALDKALAIFDRERSRGIDIKDAIAAAEALGQAGDPRFADPQAPLGDINHSHWALIPAGKFWMGAQKTDPKEHNYDSEAYPDESPVHEVELSEYRIGRYPVTVCEYQCFVEDGGYKRLEFWRAGGAGTVTGPHGWEEQLDHPTRPVVNVNWHEAAAYAEWATSILGQRVNGATVRLATEAQWERAACGTEGRKYPWGNQDADPSLLNYFASGIGRATPVGVYPLGATPEGVCDLAGNVWEWCGDWYADSYANAKNQDPVGPDSGLFRVLRGGSWYHLPLYCRSADRDWNAPGSRNYIIGFRVAVDSK